jgi:flagellar biosynthesis/type III secretory pathway chaperone
MKDNNISRVLEIMKDERAIFERILEISTKKTDIIVKREIEELEKITNMEFDLAGRLEVLEIERLKIIKEFAAGFGIKREDFDISELAKFFEGETSKNLIQIKEDINKILYDLKNINEVNGKLLKNSLEYVDFLVNLVTNIDDSTDNKYSNQGKLSEANAPRRMFDLKL